MNNWKDLFVLSTFWSGLSLYALQEPKPVAQASTPPAKEAVAVLSPATNPTNTTDQRSQEEHLLEAFGQLLARNAGLVNLGLKPPQIDQITHGIKTVCSGGKSITLKAEEIENLQQFLERQEKEQIENNKKAGETFLKTKQGEPGFQKTPLGSACNIIKPGVGPHPTDDCNVKIDCDGTFINGESFESIRAVVVHVGGLISGLKEGIKLVGQGGEIQVVIPPNLAYGDESVGPVPGGSTLIFSVKVLEIIFPTLEKEEPKKEEPKKEESKTDAKATPK